MRMVATDTPVAISSVDQCSVVATTPSGDVVVRTIREDCYDEMMAAACVRASAFSPKDVMASGWKFKQKREKVFDQMKNREAKGATFLVAVARDEVIICV